VREVYLDVHRRFIDSKPPLASASAPRFTRLPGAA
jgi:hypothetical protein